MFKTDFNRRWVNVGGLFFCFFLFLSGRSIDLALLNVLWNFSIWIFFKPIPTDPSHSPTDFSLIGQNGLTVYYVYP